MKVALALLGGIAALLLLVELAVVPVADRLIARELEEADLVVAEVGVTEIRRPAVFGFAAGRLQDVEVVASGVELGDFRIEEAHADARRIELGWGPADASDVPPADVTLRATAPDLRAGLAERTPLDLDPILELRPGTAELGLEPIPVTVELHIEVTDGVLRVAPAGGLPDWFLELGLDLEFELPEQLAIDQVQIEDGAVVATLQVDLAELREELREDDPGAVGGAGASGGTGAPFAPLGSAPIRPGR